MGDDAREPGEADRGGLGGRETARFYAGNWVFPIALGGGAVWVGGGRPGLSKVDPVTAVRAVLAHDRSPDVSGVAFGEGSVWVTSSDRERALVRLNPETGDVEARIELDGPAGDLVVDERPRLGGRAARLD